tara:strand:- start:328 stop:531 length:204 start_codon:yes stop_codon:yes gene_type:complete
MKRNSVLKKFDKEIENLFDTLYKIKDLLEEGGDYELSELGSGLLDQVAEGLQEGDITVDSIREQISG